MLFLGFWLDKDNEYHDGYFTDIFKKPMTYFMSSNLGLMIKRIDDDYEIIKHNYENLQK